MLGLVLLYFIGKKFYELAEEYNKHKWGIAILGVATYYTSAFIFGMLLGVFLMLIESNFLETANDLLLGLIAAPFGILGCYVLYKGLEKNWKKNKPMNNGSLIDQIGES